MIIKVCGMREDRNIHDVLETGADWIGLDFRPGSERYVSQIPSYSGIIPDYGSLSPILSNGRCGQTKKYLLCGVFADDMPQNIVMRVVNYGLDIVQLDGEESTVMIDNLRRTLDPDIHAGIRIMKRIAVTCREDMELYKDFADSVDYFLFDLQAGMDDWTLLEAYRGDVPFFLGGAIGTKNTDRLKSFSHPRFYGIDLNEEFETAPAFKDTTRLKAFLDKLR